MPKRRTPDHAKCWFCEVTFKRTILRGVVERYCSKACQNAEYRRRRIELKGGVRRFGAALDLTSADNAMRERFWAKVQAGGSRSCWPWTGYVNQRGYGQWAIKKGWTVTSSRAAFALANGPLADGEVVRHSCDNPPCCNPAHLLKGTQVDNAMDCQSRGRQRRSRGMEHRSARLSEGAVREIRATPIKFGTKAELTRRYGVSHNAICAVLSGSTWRSVA